MLVENVFLVTRPHTVEEAACFGHYRHYLVLRMLSSITNINVSILSLVCSGNVQGRRIMITARPHALVSSDVTRNTFTTNSCLI